jgi:hypothetical protein
MDDVRSFNAVQNHVHDADDVGQPLLFLAVKAALLQGLGVSGGQFAAMLEVFKRFRQEARRTDRAVINPVTDFRRDDFDDGFNQRARGVILAAIAPGIAHVLDFVFVEMRHFVLLFFRPEAQAVHEVEDFPQVITALNLVFQLAENLAYLVFNGVRTGRIGLELFKVRE